MTLRNRLHNNQSSAVSDCAGESDDSCELASASDLNSSNQGQAIRAERLTPTCEGMFSISMSWVSQSVTLITTTLMQQTDRGISSLLIKYYKTNKK